MPYAICNKMFSGWDWAETCHAVAEAGYHGIEVAPSTLAEDVRVVRPHARHVYRHTAERSGLRIIGLNAFLPPPSRLSLTTHDESVRKETADVLAAMVDFCADLGGTILTIGSSAQRDLSGSDIIQQATDRMLDCLTPALRRAEQRKVTICLESLPAQECNFTHTLQELTQIVARVNHSSLKVVLDIRSASREADQLPSLIKHYADCIAHVHANDASGRGPGFGDTNFVPILAALRDSGYNGYLSVEVFDNPPDPIRVARESLAYLRHCEAQILPLGPDT